MGAGALGRRGIVAVAVLTMILPVVADWNRTHVFNPRWPPHARFHGGHTIAVGVLAGALALWALWRAPADARTRLREAATFASVYWLSQAFASLTPGAALLDPEYAVEFPRVLELTLNPLTLDVVVLTVLLGSYLLARRHVGPADGSLTGH